MLEANVEAYPRRDWDLGVHCGRCLTYDVEPPSRQVEHAEQNKGTNGMSVSLERTFDNAPGRGGMRDVVGKLSCWS